MASLTIVVYGQPAPSSTYYPSYTPDSRLYSWPTPIAPPAGQDLFTAWCPGLTNSHVVPGSAYCMPIAPLPAYVPSSAVYASSGQPAVGVTVAGATATQVEPSGWREPTPSRTHPSLDIYGVGGGATYYLDDLSDLTDPARLAGLDDNVRMRAELLAEAVRRYRHAVNETDPFDAFTNLWSVCELWKQYRALRDGDKDCLSSGSHGPPHKKCLRKAFDDLRDNLLEERFNKLYSARNEVVHEAREGAALSYVGLLLRCAGEAIERMKGDLAVAISRGRAASASGA